LEKRYVFTSPGDLTKIPLPFNPQSMHFTDCTITRLILKFTLVKKDVEEWFDAIVDCSEQVGRFSCSKKQNISLAIYSRKIVYVFN
jgi:hypothetical protein